ncbi:MAG: alpha/beta hydrolase [Dehalococcoidia bacterium]
MMLTSEQQQDTLVAAARALGVAIEKDDIAWQDREVVVDGLRVHYLDWGDEGRPPLLLMHGGMQTAHSWDLIAVALKQRYHVVAVDMRGHGDSDWEGDYGYESHARDLEALVAHLGWPRFVLVGLSLGGLAAMLYASEHSDTLAALAIVDVGPELNVSGVNKIVDFGRAPGELDSIDAYVDRASQFNPRRNADALRYTLSHNLRRLENGKLGWKYDTRVANSRGERREPPAPGYFSELWERLPHITCPTLVVRGAESNVFLEKTGRKMADLLPSGRFVTIADAGHTVPQDNPSAFLETLSTFLNESK